MAQTGGQWLLLLVLVAGAGVVWLLRVAVASAGFPMLILVVLPWSCAAGYAIGLPPPGTISKAELMAATDMLNLAYIGPRTDVLDRAADVAHAMHLTPNALTMSCLLVVLALGYAVLHGYAFVALGLWLYYAFVDELDGHVARRFGQMSKLGAWLDAIVDVGSHTTIAFATVCSPHGVSGEWGEGAAITLMTFAVGITLQQVYDEALDVARGAPVSAAETIPAVLGFLRSDATQSDAHAALGLLGLVGHGFVRYVSHPLALLCHLYVNTAAQASLLVAHIGYALAIRRSTLGVERKVR